MSDGTSIPVPLLSGGLTVLKLTTMTLVAAIWQPARALFPRLAGGCGLKVYPLKLAINLTP